MKSKWLLWSMGLALGAGGLSAGETELERAFRQPDDAARPWAYWYWLNAAVTEPAIDADLAAMKAAGLAGAFLMPIKGPLDPAQITPPVTQLSPLWWQMVRHAFAEADRLGVKLALHDCDGFATAGGPWITPELSMQHLVWSETQITGGAGGPEWTLAQPAAQEGFYRDVAVLAFPAPEGAGRTSWDRPVQVTAGELDQASGAGHPGQALAPARRGPDAIGPATSHPDYLARPLAAPLATYGQVPKGMSSFSASHPCWISFDFAQPFTCRAVTIRSGNSGTYTANRPRLEASDDGVHFRPVAVLESPRHGWEDWDAGVTHAIPPTTARCFRLVYDRPPGEPGAEDLDSAKWSTLKLLGVQFLSAERIDNFEGKSGALWRIAPAVALAHPIAQREIVNLTGQVDPSGHLRWTPPPGRWTVLRLGTTSTGHYNETGGGGRGLECDKFNPAAARLQFDRWFGEAERQIGPALAGRTLPIFHIDSWECGSQNWSPVFAAEFRRRRGYDLTLFLPAMAGFGVESTAVSERFLRDVRRTIAELVVDNFYRPMAALAHEHGCLFSAESVAPTLVSDGMAHFDAVDLPMGEFWLRSPTHDKLNDVLDAVSGARIYGKRIAQSEAFTELKLGWDEAPGMLKPLADRNYALGLNRFVYHVFMLNPWLDRRPGMTLNGVGTFFQRDQTWWKPAGRTWTDYAARCQSLLQQGAAAADLAVFTGEELPRRALVPWELAGILPGVLGARTAPPLGHPAIRSPDDWVDPLGGYAYDSLNRDALLRLAEVKDGRIVLPGGASYAALVVPGSRPMDPDAAAMSPEVAAKLAALARAGATIILGERPHGSPSLENYPACDAEVARLGAELWASPHIRRGAWLGSDFTTLGLERDFLAEEGGARAPPGSVAWTHRRGEGWDLYFVANPVAADRSLQITLRAAGQAELWNPVTGERSLAAGAASRDGRTVVPLDLPANGSIFVVLRPAAASLAADQAPPLAAVPNPSPLIALDADWSVQFDPKNGGPSAPLHFGSLVSWTDRPEEPIRHYAGTAVYRRSFEWHYGKGERGERVWLDLGQVGALARVTVNGTECGVAWTPPFRVEITGAVRKGSNSVEVAVTNPWRNRLIGDRGLRAAQRQTWTNAPDLPASAAPLPSGLLGPVALEVEGTGASPSPELPSLPVPALGVAWYPEQWREAAWAADLALMEQAHVGFVRIGEFAWSSLEPSEGHFDLDWMERAVAAAAAHHLAVVIGTPTDTPPAWLTRRYPDTLRIDAEGRQIQHGSRRQFSYASARYRQFCRRIDEELGRRFGHDPRVVAWQIGNELTEDSYDPEARAQFHAWLQARYGSLAELNRRWATAYWSQTYDDWAEIPMGGERGNPGLRLEYQRFVTATWRAFQAVQVAALRAQTGGRQPITTNLGGLGWADRFDRRKLAGDLDFIAWDEYVGTGHLDAVRGGASNDLVRGWRQQNFWVMEMQPAFVDWAKIATALDPGETRAMAWQAVGHGADAVAFWQWRAAPNGQEQYHGTLVGADGAPVPFYAEAQRIGREFGRASAALSGTQPEAEVAIAHDYDSRWAIEFHPQTEQYDVVDVLMRWYGALRPGTQAVDIVDPTDPRCDLQRYKLIVAPGLNVISPSLAERLRQYVRRGGHLVLGPRSGMKDEFNALDPRRQPGPLAADLGARVEQYYALGQDIPVSGEWGSGQAVIWGEQLQPAGGGAAPKVLLRYARGNGWLDGQAAAVEQPLGQGRLIYLGAMFDAKLLRRIAQALAEEAGVEWVGAQPGRRTLPAPEGVEVCRRVGPGREVFILTNFASAAVQVALTPPLHDVLAGQDVASIELPRHGVAVLRRPTSVP